MLANYSNRPTTPSNTPTVGPRADTGCRSCIFRCYLDVSGFPLLCSTRSEISRGSLGALPLIKHLEVPAAPAFRASGFERGRDWENPSSLQIAIDNSRTTLKLFYLRVCVYRQKMLRGKMTLIQLLSLLFLLVAVYADTGTIIHMFWKNTYFTSGSPTLFGLHRC